LDESEPVSFRDLLRVRVEDRNGRFVGHLEDMALEEDLSAPYIDFLGVHLLWTDRVADVMLVRRAEEVAVLMPFSEVAGITDNLVTLRSTHPDFPVASAAGKWLVRRDILDKQMVDPEGNRIQRVDDVVLTYEAGRLKVAGLEVSKGLLMASSALRRYMAELRRKHSSKHDSEVIPWDAVQRVDDDAIVLGEDVRH
jgi:sporulation protein YlmC with PRC-barrel domain